LGTVADFPDFDANGDAEALYNAMKGFGSDKEAILDLVTSRSNGQRQEIRSAYKSLYGKNTLLQQNENLNYFFIIGAGTDEKCLIEILASRTNQQIHDLVAAYNDAYGRDIEQDIIGDTSGHFKKMLVVLLQGTREDDGVVHEEVIEEDAQALFAAGEEQWGTDESIFIMLLGNRSVTHLQLVFDEYQKIAEKSIEDSIKSELSGDFERLMLAVVQCIRSRPMFFAKRLYKSMKGLGTADNTLIRIMISRSEIDMLDIRECFRLRYEKSLHNMIQDDTSGEYKRTLLKLCGGDDDIAGEFFPEAAQIAYKMWEISAMTKVQLRGTVHPISDFDPGSDAQDLRKAMKGFGTDEDTIIEIVAKRSNEQRQEIRHVFKSILGRCEGSISRVRAQFCSKYCNGAGTDEHALIEILVTRSNQEIQDMCAAYKKAFKKNLEDAIRSDTSGHFCRILVSLAQTHYIPPLPFSQALADACNAESDEMMDKFMSILCTRSFPHLRRVFQEFVRCSNKDIEQIIKKEMSGDIKNAMYAIVRSVKNQPSYLADRLYKAMKGLGTDDRALIRIMVSRSEIDLFNIRKEFKDTHDTSLHDFIQVEALVVSVALLVSHNVCVCV
uniref:Annexin n=1 Tax=Astyanax mexicanus TaxID=7994 RepID=A0A8B9KMZ2_ASTMX